MTEADYDIKFLLHIINEIAKYANKNGIEVDSLIADVAAWLNAMREVATFNNLKGDWDDTDEIIRNIKGMIEDININEIKAHDTDITLDSWLRSWRGEMKRLIGCLESKKEN